MWREVGHTKKYCLSPRNFLRAQAIFHRIPWLESQYSHSQLPLLANIFSYWLRELAISSCIYLVSRSIQVRILARGNVFPYSPFEDSAMAALKVHLEICFHLGRNIATVIFQYSGLRMPCIWLVTIRDWLIDWLSAIQRLQ